MSNSRKWFLRPVSGEFPARLFCLPYSGCGASMFRGWPRAIGPVEVCPLQLPGRENRTREPHYGTYEDLADELVPVLRDHLDRPYAFFGHCGGVLPGFETAVRIVEAGLPPPAHFFVSSQVAPHDGPYGRYLGLTPDELATELVGLLTAIGGGNPPRPEMVDLVLDVLVADVAANKRYRKDAPVRLPCPITVLGWREDAEVPVDLMGGWAACAERVRLELLSGGHYAFLDPPGALVAIIQRDLEAALATAGHPG